MKGGRLLFAYVFLLVLAGGGLLAWKVIWLGYPIIPSETRDEWLLEAKVSFQPTGDPITVSLALPKYLEERVLSSEAASVGYGFLREQGEEWRAVWTARERPGTQRLYFRLRVPEKALAVRKFSSRGDKPAVVEPALTGMTAEAAKSLVEHLVAHSADEGSFVRQACALLLREEDRPETGVLRRYYEKRSAELWLEAAVVDLAALNGISARVAYGLRLEEEPGVQTPVRLIEYRDDSEWVVLDPSVPEEVFPEGVAVWSRGGGSLLVVEGGENSSVTFATTRVQVAADVAAISANHPIFVSLFDSLPLSERSVFRYIVLIPIGVLIVVIFRNFIGIVTLGTFMPVLLALAFLEIPIILALVMFGTMLAVALVFRFMLSRLHLLVVPRVAACVVVVSLLMLIFSAAGHRVGFATSLQITLFPLIILAWTVERMSLLWDEEGAWVAIKQILGSVVVAWVAFVVMRLHHVQHVLTFFPEVLLIVLAIIMLLGRYTGYRLFELMRFRKVEEDLV